MGCGAMLVVDYFFRNELHELSYFYHQKGVGVLCFGEGVPTLAFPG